MTSTSRKKITPVLRYNTAPIRRKFRRIMAHEFLSHSAACEKYQIDRATMRRLMIGKPMFPQTVRQIAGMLRVPMSEIMPVESDSEK